MNANENLGSSIGEEAQKAEYEAPVVRVMSEAEILSAFQVNAAGTMAWWVA